MTPFTYCITHIPSGKKYYGSRYSKTSKLSDLGTKYISSSKTLRNLILEEGRDQFIFEIRKVFDSKEECIAWELKVLKRLDAMNSEMWFNRSNGGGSWRYKSGSGPRTPEVRKRISEKLRGRPKSDHVRNCVSEANRRRVFKETTRQKHSINNSGSGNPMFGRSRKGEVPKWSEKGRERILESLSCSIRCHGIVYPSIKAAEAALGYSVIKKLDNPKFPEFERLGSKKSRSKNYLLLSTVTK